MGRSFPAQKKSGSDTHNDRLKKVHGSCGSGTGGRDPLSHSAT